MAFTRYADGPDNIIVEGQEITITFTRVTESTGLIKWNIPPPAAGCNSETQAYDGIVITIDNKAANYITTSPVNGHYYSPDPTSDRDLHLGSKLDTALVIGAFYNDKTTTSMVVTGLTPKTPYYVSGYAVDAQARYHTQGVHAYSLPTGVGDLLTPDTAGYQDIEIYSKLPMSPNSPTGLFADKHYKFSIEMCCKRYDYEIHGHEALSYKDLIKAINTALTESTCVVRGPMPPNAGEYYMKMDSCELFLFDGWKYTTENVTCAVEDPRIPLIDTYWYDPDTDTLYVYETGGWVIVDNIIISLTDPTNVIDGTIWFDGTNAWKWEGTHWCKLCVYISERNPLFPPVMSEGVYWYNNDSLDLYSWSTIQKKWLNTTAIYSYVDPNNMVEGEFWFDETSGRMMMKSANGFEEPSQIYYKEPTASGDYPLKPRKSIYWFINSTGKFYQRNLDNTEWEPIQYVSFPTDPTIRKSCDLWWDSVTDLLYVWDAVNSIWKEVVKFYQQETDPRIPPTLPDCAVWYNPKTKQIMNILSAECEDMGAIISKYDPTNLPIGTIWRWKDTWKKWDGTVWEIIHPIYKNINPFDLPENSFWFDSNDKVLFKLIQGIWTPVSYSATDLTPEKGVTWFDTVNNQLMEWDGVTWIPSTPFAYVKFEERGCREDFDRLRFYTKKVGCTTCETPFKIIIESDNLFSHLKPSVMYKDAVPPNDGLVKGPTTLQLGVGTDGSPLERRELTNKIMIMLGYPSIQVELTKEQINFAIDNALQVLRKNSSYAYLRALFFLDLLPNQQIYRMTNECVGFNKIVDINTIYRMRGSVFKPAYANNDAFTFAALQQMYALGTFDILTFHMTASYMEELETLFAQRIMFQWTERSRELRLHNSIGGKERVLIDCVIERTEQDLMTDRQTITWIQDWAEAECRAMLADIRGKYTSLPGPNGTTMLNGAELLAQSQDAKEKLMEQLYDDGLMQDLVNVGLRAHMVMG